MSESLENNESTPERKKSAEISEFTAQDFIEYRRHSAAALNNLTEAYYQGELKAMAIQEQLMVDDEQIGLIMFVLDSFRKPRDESKTFRNDGSHIAVHSIQLFETARNKFGINYPEVLNTLLLHDIEEDTQLTNNDIRKKFGDRTAELASIMTEQVSESESSSDLNKSDQRKVSIIHFIKQLKTGGEAIAIAETFDRMDDVSDLKYITDKVDGSQEQKDKAENKLAEKFAKCLYTIDQVTDSANTSEVNRLREFFNQVIQEQRKTMFSQYGLEITDDAIGQEYERYKELEKHN